MLNSIITISRQFGSGGRFIGRKLAEKLQLPFFDNELITLAAKESGYAESLFEQAEQISTHSLLFSLSMFGTSSAAYGMPLADKVYLIQSEVIHKVAENGPCIIVGRCADYVLKENPNTVNVFIHAELPERVKRAVQFYNLNSKEAENTIHKIDKKREAYYNYYTGEKWGDVQNYHLSLDSGAVGIDACVNLIEQFVKAKENLIRNP